jgi:hypothetical protein
MAIKTSYMAVGYKERSLYTVLQKVPPFVNHGLFLSLGTEGVMLTNFRNQRFH